MAVLDTNALIALDKKNDKAIALVQSLVDDGVPMRVPATAWVEYLVGVPLKRRSEAQANLDRTTFFEAFTRDFATLAVQLQADLMSRGMMMAASDLQVAVTALHYDEPIVSNDKAFDSIPALVRLAF